MSRDMFTTEGIEVLGTPVGIDRYIQTFVAQKCLQIMQDVGKHAILTDGFVHIQLLKFCENTRTQYITATINIPDSEHQHVDRKIAYEILQKGTRGSFRNWPRQDIDLATTMLQMPHGMGGYGLTPNVIAQISAKVAMASRFLGFIGSMTPPEQKLRFPNQNLQDPVTWVLPHVLQLKHEYLKLVADFNWWVLDHDEFLNITHRVTTHKVTLATGNERGDIEIRDYVILPRGVDNRIPPRTLLMDVTMTHDRFGRTTQRTNGALTHRVSAPQPDGALNNAARIKIRHYRHLYADRSDPIVFLPVAVRTSGRVYDDFLRLIFLHAHREASILYGELPEEQFRFLRAACWANFKGSIGLILAKPPQ
jgi:hypothetical protein